MAEPLEERIIERARWHYRQKERFRAKRREWAKCEVIVCGNKGPHRCESWATVRRSIDGRLVCSFHNHNQRVAVFTDDDAWAIHRARLEKERLEIDPQEGE